MPHRNERLVRRSSPSNTPAAGEFRRADQLPYRITERLVVTQSYNGKLKPSGIQEHMESRAAKRELGVE